jgi:AcrR family transcriptional regulator
MDREISKRPYRMKKRAELQEETRLRITESAVELHGTLGPSRTSVTAVAAHAGVRRSTLYRHFPDEAALFAACTAHWGATNPAPDLSEWAATAGPDARLQRGLAELYAYYTRTEEMFANILRDESTMPIVAAMLTHYRDYLAHARETLIAGRPERGHARRRVRATVGHALAFATWRSLAREQDLGNGETAALMCLLVDAARGSGGASSVRKAAALSGSR